MKIDPILLSVYARTFKSITDEMSISMQQTTRSPILCEAKDYVTGLYDAEGRMLEQTENLPILAFSLAPVCKYIRNYFKDDLHPGDVIFHNDVFSLGNQNNDVAVYMPIFYADELVAWTAVKGHQADIGGAVAIGSDNDSIRMEEVGYGGSFAQELGVRDDVKHIARDAVAFHDPANPLVCVDRNCAFLCDHFVSCDRPGDFARDRLDIRQVGISCFALGCSYRYEDCLCFTRGGRQVGCETHPGVAISLQEVRQIFFVDQTLSAL